MSAFQRLNQLLRAIEPPADVSPILMHLGEIDLPPPKELLIALDDPDGWFRYPPLGGTEAMRAAYQAWAERRFSCGALLTDEDISFEPTAGTKQALATIVSNAVAKKRAEGVSRPAILVPNPYYPSYHASCVAAGAEPEFYTASGESVSTAILDALCAVKKNVAAILICNPSSPDGRTLTADDQISVAIAAARAGILLIVDECYIDFGVTNEPISFLSLLESRLAPRCHSVVLHTLSKRSRVPGLRSGFLVGSSEYVKQYASINRACGVSSGYPICAVSAALWNNDSHVVSARQFINVNWDLADKCLSSVSGYRRAESGFFIWLPVIDDEAVAVKLWREFGVKVLPGRYLAAEPKDGMNPGKNRIRIALVQRDDRSMEALIKIRKVMTENGRTASA